VAGVEPSDDVFGAAVGHANRCCLEKTEQRFIVKGNCAAGDAGRDAHGQCLRAPIWRRCGEAGTLADNGCRSARAMTSDLADRPRPGRRMVRRPKNGEERCEAGIN
jgi:hypothetical protein